MLTRVAARRKGLGMVQLASAQFVRYKQRRKAMEVLLARDVPGRGSRGDVIRVSPGFARHRLIPDGDAVPAALVDEVQAVHHQLEEDASHARERLLAASADLQSGAGLHFRREPSGTGRLLVPITLQDVMAEMGQLQTGRVAVNVESMEPEVVDTVGEHTVTLHLGHGVGTQVRVTVSSRRPVHADADAGASSA